MMTQWRIQAYFRLIKTGQLRARAHNCPVLMNLKYAGSATDDVQAKRAIQSAGERMGMPKLRTNSSESSKTWSVVGTRS